MTYNRPLELLIQKIQLDVPYDKALVVVINKFNLGTLQTQQLEAAYSFYLDEDGYFVTDCHTEDELKRNYA